jgi:hypothetical protein
MRNIQPDIITNVYRSSCMVPVILVRFQLNFNFLDRYTKSTQISNFVKIRPVGAELFRANRQGRHGEANSRNSQFRERA